MSSLTASPLMNAVGWTLIHSLWQAALVACVLYLILGISRNLSAVYRHGICLLGLLVVMFLSLSTFWVQMASLSNDASSVLLTVDSAQSAVASGPLEGRPPHSFLEGPLRFWSEIRRLIGAHMIWIVVAWMGGLLISFVRLSGGLTHAIYLRHRGTLRAPARWMERLGILARSLGIHRIVTIAESPHVAAPMVLGIFRPMILFPIGALMRLPTDQVEAVLLHELAHIARRDIAVAIFQSFVEVIFFFNPAVRWISNRIREERESCCDEAALNAGAGALDLARALVTLQESTMQIPKVAFSVLGHRNDLLGRIQRIVGKPKQRPVFFVNALLVSLFMCLFCAAALFAGEGSEPNPGDTQKAASVKNTSSDAKELDRLLKIVFPSGKGTTEVNRNTGPDWFRELFGLVSELRLSVKGGEIQELILNGQKVAPEEIPSHYPKLIELLQRRVPIAHIKANQLETIHEQIDAQTKVLEKLKQNEGDTADIEQELKELERELSLAEEKLAQEKVLLGKEMGLLGAQLDGWKTIRRELEKDGILKTGESFEAEIGQNFMSVNGVELPESLFGKYKSMIERSTGSKLKRGTKIHFNSD